MLISVIFWISCKRQTNAMESGYSFAEIQARLTQGNRQLEIRRRMITDPSGLKAVFSEISTFTQLSGFETTTQHLLCEYLVGDSVFIYDSGDSTNITLSVHDIRDVDTDLFPGSAAWLLIYQSVKKTTSKEDTTNIYGLPCRKELIEGGDIWIYDKQPIAIETSRNGFSHSEKVTMFVTDTVFPESHFRHPQGFRKLIPSDKIQH